MVKIIRVVIMAATALGLAACDGGSPPPPAPTVALMSSATDVGFSGPPVTLTWSSTHATECTTSGEWNHPVGTAGSEEIVVGRTSTYVITCSGRGGAATASVTIRAWMPPTVSIEANNPYVQTLGATLLNWAAQNATECRGFLGPPEAMQVLQTSGSQITPPLTETTRFQVICSNPAMGTASAEVVVKVVTPTFRAVELPMSRATALNDAGDVAGQRPPAPNYSGPYDAVAWIGGTIVGVRACQQLNNCMNSYTPLAINADRTVIGRGSMIGHPMHPYSFIWHYGDYPYDSGGNEFLSYSDINDAGEIVGGKRFGAGALALLISDGTEVLLFSPNLSDSYASAINAAGHIAGSVQAASDAKCHLFLYVEGAINDLGTPGDVYCAASDINAADAIVGWEDRIGGTRTFLYANSRFTDLGSLGGTISRATAINDAGRIVGSSTLPGADPQAQRAFLYVDGRMTDLNELVEPLPVPLTEAPKINDRGQIIANACPPPGASGACRAYLLTPLTSH